MLSNGIIRRSNCPYSAPICPEKGVCETFDKLGRDQYFSTINLARGFQQIEVEEKDINKTAFTIEGGHYEYVRMPFSL